MYSLVVYIPENDLDMVKNALFNAGAGQIGEYEHCAWETKGQGQFRPLQRAQPTIGSVGILEEVEEYRVEFVVIDKKIRQVLQTLHLVHPYETPAYHCFQVFDINSIPL